MQPGRGAADDVSAVVPLLLAFAAAAGPAVFRTGQPVMGTVLQVTIMAGDEPTTRVLAEAALAEARRWDDILTTWRPGGELAQLNASAGAGPVEVSPDLAYALAAMLRLSADTGGAFDPAVAPLVDLWRGPEPPRPEVLALMRRQRISDVLALDGRRATLVAGAKLDAGGIGKGLALDAIAALLRARGARAAYLDFGGSSQLAIGSPPDSPAGWQIAVGGLAPHAILGTVTLRDAALSTSRATGASSPAGPIIDPRTGRPAATPRIATVRAGDATTAEAWSKAVAILGAAGLERAAARGLGGLFEDAGGVTRSPDFALAPLPARP